MAIAFPDDLLERFEALSRRRGTTPEELLTDLVERELDEDTAQRRETIRQLLAGATSHGGDSARLVREMRDAR